MLCKVALPKNVFKQIADCGTPKRNGKVVLGDVWRGDIYVRDKSDTGQVFATRQVFAKY